MEKIQSQQNEDCSDSIDAYEIVIGPENSGLYGRGITKKILKRKRHSEPSFSTTMMRCCKINWKI